MANQEAEKFFASLPTETEEKQFNFFEEKKEEPQEPKPEKAEEVVEEQDEEKLEKRPNRQERRREQNKFFEDQMAKKDQMLEQLQTELLKRSAPSQEEEDTRLTRLFGDTPQGKEASRIVQELLKETEERAVSPYRELEQQRQAEAEQESRFDQEIETGLENVEDTYGVDLTSRSAKQTRSDFLDFVDELSPEDGFVNFEKAWSLFQSNQKAPRDTETLQRKKDIASRSIQRSVSQKPDVPTKPVTFDAIDGIFGKMFGKK